MNSMTVSTQKSEVSFIGFPVLKSSTPSPLSVFGLNLRTRVYVVYIEGAVIVKSTLATLAAKFFYDGKLSLPITSLFVNGVTILVPVVFLATIRTELVFAFAVTVLAVAIRGPSIGKVALLRAVFPIPFSHQIGRDLLGRAARFAYDFHTQSITRSEEPRYFETACERIDNAQRQQRLAL